MICHNTSFGNIEFTTNPNGVDNNFSYEWQVNTGFGWLTAENNIDSNLYPQDYNHTSDVSYKVLVCQLYVQHIQLMNFI